MASSKPRLKIAETRLTRDKQSVYSPKPPGPKPYWMRKALPYFRMLPRTFPKPTRPAAPAAPETSDFISGSGLPCCAEIPLSTIIGNVERFSNSGSSSLVKPGISGLEDKVVANLVICCRCWDGSGTVSISSVCTKGNRGSASPGKGSLCISLNKVEDFSRCCG